MRLKLGNGPLIWAICCQVSAVTLEGVKNGHFGVGGEGVAAKGSF
jgi:hypothetical protein